MVFKRYIKRGGKVFGPYYYESYRDKNGKVRKKYLGISEPKIDYSFYIILIALISGILILLSIYFSTITGFLVSGNDNNVNSSFGNVFSCENLDTPNTIYVLGNDIQPGEEEKVCFNVNAENIILDCRGYKIYNTNFSGIAVYSNQLNTKIQNCNIITSNLNYSYGIKLENSRESFIINNTISSYHGIYLSNSSGNNLINNIVEEKGYSGVSFNFSNNNTVYNLDAGGNIGMYISNGTGNIINNCNLYSKNYDILVEDFLNNTKISLTLTNCTYNLSKEAVNGGSNFLSRKWYLRMHVKDYKKNDITGINVVLYSAGSVLEFDSLSDINGYTEVWEVKEYINKGGEKSYFDYRINITNAAYEESYLYNVSKNNLDYVIYIKEINESTDSNIGNFFGETCISEWECQDWSECKNLQNSFEKGILDSNLFYFIRLKCGLFSWNKENCGFQIRNCIDKNSCNKEESGLPSDIDPDIERFLEENKEAVENIQEEQDSIKQEEIPKPAGRLLRACVPKFKCGEWSKCYAEYDLSNLVDNKVLLNGLRHRICKDINECVFEKVEKEECKIDIPVHTKKIVRCSKEYSEVYDKNGTFISRFDLKEEEPKRLDIFFSMDGSEFCDYCYNNIKDYNEDEIDCVYEGDSCPLCSEKNFKGNLNAFNTLFFSYFVPVIIFIQILAVLWLLLLIAEYLILSGKVKIQKLFRNISSLKEKLIFSNTFKSIKFCTIILMLFIFILILFFIYFNMDVILTGKAIQSSDKLLNIQECMYTNLASCNDDIKNCHEESCEIFTDCGGPCQSCMGELPQIIKLKYLGLVLPSILLMLVILIIFIVLRKR